MRVNFNAATLAVATGTGKTPIVNLRSVDPITVDGTVADTVSDGRFSVTLSPEQSKEFAALLAAPTDAFIAAISAGSIVLPDATKGRRPAKGESLVGLLGITLPDPSANAADGEESAPQTDGEAVPVTEPASDTPAPKARRGKAS